jgi:hypothetical protein
MPGYNRLGRHTSHFAHRGQRIGRGETRDGTTRRARLLSVARCSVFGHSCGDHARVSHRNQTNPPGPAVSFSASGGRRASQATQSRLRDAVETRATPALRPTHSRARRSRTDHEPLCRRVRHTRRRLGRLCAEAKTNSCRAERQIAGASRRPLEHRSGLWRNHARGRWGAGVVGDFGRGLECGVLRVLGPAAAPGAKGPGYYLPALPGLTTDLSRLEPGL